MRSNMPHLESLDARLLLAVITSVGRPLHQCAKCCSPLFAASWTLLRLKSLRDSLQWPLCCTVAELRTRTVRHYSWSSPGVESYHVQLLWQYRQWHLGGTVISFDTRKPRGDVVFEVECQLEEAVRQRLRLPCLSDLLLRTGAPMDLACCLARHANCTMSFHPRWLPGSLEVLIELGPTPAWPLLRDFVADRVRNSGLAMVCIFCCSDMALPGDLLECRHCLSGPACCYCYDEDLDLCIQCPRQFRPYCHRTCALQMRSEILLVS